MAKRVGLVLSGCGARDGSEIREAVLTWLALERQGAEVICAAPAVLQERVVDHLTGDGGGPPRAALVEAARIARGEIRDLAKLSVDDVDALVLPGGEGVASVLSNYASKGPVCDVHPELVRLLKGCLATHRPMGFVCLAPILAARVLGPIAGVRLTFGSRGTPAAKHAAVMGADVRPCAVDDVILDKKAGVISTPAYMYEDARLPQVADAINKLARLVVSMARDRHPAAQTPARPAAKDESGAG